MLFSRAKWNCGASIFSIVEELTERLDGLTFTACVLSLFPFVLSIEEGWKDAVKEGKDKGSCLLLRTKYRRWIGRWCHFSHENSHYRDVFIYYALMLWMTQSIPNNHNINTYWSIEKCQGETKWYRWFHEYGHGQFPSKLADSSEKDE